MTKKGHSSSGTLGWLKRWRWYCEGGLVMGGPGTLWLVLLDTGGTEALDTALILDYRGNKCLDELSPNLLKLLTSLPRQEFGGKEAYHCHLCQFCTLQPAPPSKPSWAQDQVSSLRSGYSCRALDQSLWCPARLRPLGAANQPGDPHPVP